MFKIWVAGAAMQIIEVLAASLMRSAVKPLLKIDERSLADVGLCRSDVIESLSAPITDNPADVLASRARQRGRSADSKARH